MDKPDVPFLCDVCNRTIAGSDGISKCASMVYDKQLLCEGCANKLIEFIRSSLPFVPITIDKIYPIGYDLRKVQD